MSGKPNLQPVEACVPYRDDNEIDDEPVDYRSAQLALKSRGETISRVFHQPGRNHPRSQHDRKHLQ